LTLTRPKVLLPVANKPILQHNLESLKGFIDEAIIVVGYRKEMVQDYFGKEFRGIKMIYVEQKKQLGTGHALLAAEGVAKDRFIAMNGDDIYHKDNIRNILDYDCSLLVEKVKDPSRFGVWIAEGNKVKDFAEKPKKFVSDIANCGLYVLDKRIFADLKKLKKTGRGEYEINEAINSLAKYQDVRCIVSNGKWIAVGYPWHLLEANEKLLQEMNDFKIEGEVEPNATIKGKVSIGKGTVIKNGTYIEGPVVIGENCSIGPNCFIRAYTSIGNNCNMGHAVEIKNCIIMDNTNVAHLSYFGDSILGFDVNIGAGCISANLRHDKDSVRTHVKNKLIDTDREKFGAIIGDGVHTGINTSIYPGRKIWPGKQTLPGEIVKKDIT